MNLNGIIAGLIGYLFGCINAAYFVGKLKGKDIRSIGSYNAGASNTYIMIGKRWGVLVGAFDILKSFLGALLVSVLFPGNELLPIIAGAAAILGHIFPFWLKFKGGKGLACMMGLLLYMDWKYFVAMGLLIVAITLITDFIAIGTISVAALMPIILIFQQKSIIIVGIFLVLAVIIFYKHIINICRIINKEEYGFLRKNRERYINK